MTPFKMVVALLFSTTRKHPLLTQTEPNEKPNGPKCLSPHPVWVFLYSGCLAQSTANIKLTILQLQVTSMVSDWTSMFCLTPYPSEPSLPVSTSGPMTWVTPVAWKNVGVSWKLQFPFIVLGSLSNPPLTHTSL